VPSGQEHPPDLHPIFPLVTWRSVLPIFQAGHEGSIPFVRSHCYAFAQVREHDQEPSSFMRFAPRTRAVAGPSTVPWPPLSRVRSGQSLSIEGLHDLLKQELHFCRDRPPRIATLHESDALFNGVVADLSVEQCDVIRVGLHARREELHC
jgi:hypothetical protein